MKPILFFDPSIRIAVHSATAESDVNRTMSIAEFSNGQVVALYELDNGDLRAETRPSKYLTSHPRFIEGPQF